VTRNCNPRTSYLRRDIEEPLIGREHSAAVDLERAYQGSEELRERTHALFRRWEKTHGFQKGAGQILLPAGYQP
jgi:hypothetical protein